MTVYSSWLLVLVDVDAICGVDRTDFTAPDKTSGIKLSIVDVKSSTTTMSANSMITVLRGDFTQVYAIFDGSICPSKQNVEHLHNDQ